MVDSLTPKGGILFTSDWHCGLALNGVQRNPELETVLKEIVDKALLLEPSSIVIIGDLSEQYRYPGISTASMIGNAVMKLADGLPDSRIFIIRGNHDWDGVNLFGLSRRVNVRCISSPVVVEMSDGEYMLAVPYLKKHEMDGKSYDQILSDMRAALPPDAKCFAAMHAALEGTVPGIEEACVTKEAAKLGIDKIFLGHIHQHKDLGDGFYYTGAIIRNTFGEEQESSGMWYKDRNNVYDVPLETPRRMKMIVFDSPEAVADGRLEQELRSAIASDPNVLIKVRINGANAYNDAIIDIARKVETEYSEPEHNIVAFDFSVKKDDKEKLLEKEAADKEVRAAYGIASQISVRSLWNEYCDTRFSADSSISEQDASVVKEAGAALLSGSEPDEIWQALKMGKFETLAEEENKKSDAEETSQEEKISAEIPENSGLKSSRDLIMPDNITDADLSIDF